MRYILLLAILLYNILDLVTSRHSTMNHRQVLEDRSNEEAQNHHNHKMRRKKVLLQTEVTDEPPTVVHKNERTKEDAIDDTLTEIIEDISSIDRNRNKNDQYIEEQNNSQDHNSVENNSDNEEESSRKHGENTIPRLKEKYEKRFVQKGDCDRTYERFDSCFSGCAAVSCDNPRDRLRPCFPFCEPGCVCVRPYVRDDRTHKCVLPADCSKSLKGIPDIGKD